MLGKPLAELRIFAIAGTLISRGTSTVLSFVLLLVVARLLSVEEYGRYAFLFSLVMGAGLLATLGQTVVLVKYFDEDQAADSPFNAALLKRADRYMLIGSALLLVCGAGYLLLEWLSGALELTRFQTGLGAFAIAVVVAGGAVFQWSEYWQARFRAEGRFALALVPRENAWRALAIICLAFVWLLPAFAGVRQNLTAGAALALVMVCLAFAMVPQFLATRRGGDQSDAQALGGSGQSTVRPFGQPLVQPFVQPRGENRSFALNTAMNAVAQHTEAIVVGLVLGFSELAVFYVVWRITMLLYLPATSIETVAAPMIANALRGEDQMRTQRLVGRFSAATFVLATIGALILLAIYPFILNLFNSQLEAPFAFVALMVGMASIQSFFGIGTGYLMIGGGEAFFLAYRTVLHVIYIVLLAAAGLASGLIGVAAVMVALIVVESALAWWWCRKHLSLEITAVGVFKGV